MMHEHFAQNAPLVYVIVITHNGRHHLERCLPSLYQTVYPRFEVVLVDNASTDGSADFVAQNYPSVIIMRNEANLGYARGNNLAILRALEAGADYVVLLNDDTELLDRRWLASATAAAEDDAQVGMVGFELTGAMIAVDQTRPVQVAPTAAIEGCALFMRSKLLSAIGLFDEVYFAYAEENDLEERARRAGYRFVAVNTPIFHLGAGTSSRFPLRQTYLVTRNVIRFSIKNRSLLRTFMRIARVLDIGCSPFPLFYDPADATHRKIRGHGNLVRNFAIILWALVWNVVRLPQTLWIARREQLLVQQGRFVPPATAVASGMKP